jgi:hypothetical protein
MIVAGTDRRDDLTLHFAMIVDLWTRNRELGDEEDNNVDDTSAYEKSGVRYA